MLSFKTDDHAQRVATDSAVIIADTISTFAFHVLTLHSKSDFTLVEFTRAPFSLNLIMETSAEDFVLRRERCAQNLLKYSATLHSSGLHFNDFETLAFDPFCAYR